HGVPRPGAGGRAAAAALGADGGGGLRLRMVLDGSFARDPLRARDPRPLRRPLVGGDHRQPPAGLRRRRRQRRRHRRPAHGRRRLTTPPRPRNPDGPGAAAPPRAFDPPNYGRISRGPSLQATLPSLTAPTLAPPGKHVMSVYVQFTPYALRDGGGWDARRADL